MSRTPQKRNVFEQVEDYVVAVYEAFDAVILNHAPTEEAVSDQSPAPVKVEEYPVTVLAIDDDAVFLDSISEMLQEKGWKVLSATNPAKGLEILRHASNEIDVVLLDYDMQKLHGDVSLEHVRKLCPDVKVIAATGMDVQSLPVSFREGVDDILLKPFGTHHLIGCICDLVGLPDESLTPAGRDSTKLE